MFEYLPWSKVELSKCLKAYQEGNYSILDIELGGECNYNCVYCDSPARNKKSNISIDNLEKTISNGAFTWIYICGLGEPTRGQNYTHLISILQLCQKYGLRCSIFSNISNLSEELISFIKAGVLFVLFKFDTQNEQRVRSLYGTRLPRKQLEAVHKIKDLVSFKDGTTNIAASIVPTQWNRDEIPELVQFCVDNHIFPLLGELESSGKGETNYQNLSLNDEELRVLKQETDAILGCDYSIPVCPAVISGIHINNENEITVDAETGFSCHWFWLKEPKTVTISKLNRDSDINQICEEITTYRSKQAKKTQGMMKDSIGSAFGGCGGDINKLFSMYLNSSSDIPTQLEMDQISDLVINAYDRIADAYAGAYSENDETDFHFFQTFIDHMKGKRVLDMGCGIGTNSQLLYSKGIDVVGVDASEGMLKNAKKTYPWLQFDKENILNTSYQDKSFDGIVLAYVIEHFNSEGLLQLKNEITRILKDGGFVFVVFHEGKETQILPDPLDDNVSIYYNFLMTEDVDKLFCDFKRIKYERRASYSPEEFVNDKVFATYQKSV